MIDFDIRPSGHPVPDAEREAMLRSPGFGQLFTDHMITLRWSAERGWHDGRLEAYGPFTLDPATSVFHYSQELTYLRYLGAEFANKYPKVAARLLLEAGKCEDPSSKI